MLSLSLLGFVKRLRYCKDEIADIEILIDETGKLLWGFYRFL